MRAAVRALARGDLGLLEAVVSVDKNRHVVALIPSVTPSDAYGYGDAFGIRGRST